MTVLSSDDPVRVFERFSTLDALSRGRAEVIVGRGSFTESFPFFGFDLANYQELSEEKLAMFVELYHRALEQLEQPTGRVGYHSFGHVAATSSSATASSCTGSRVAPLVRDMLA